MLTLDPVWERDFYGAGKFQRCPYDYIASFVFRHAPADTPRDQVDILEVGCGPGNNVWFLANEGFSLSGIDGSESAIAYARRRVAADGLTADLRVGNFLSLPFLDSSFDLIFDRAALCYVGYSALKVAIAEIHRVLKPGGRFFFNPYSREHVGYKVGRAGSDGLVVDEMHGTGPTLYCDRSMIDELFAGAWSVLELQHAILRDELTSQVRVADWRVVVRKLASE